MGGALDLRCPFQMDWTPALVNPRSAPLGNDIYTDVKLVVRSGDFRRRHVAEVDWRQRAGVTVH